MLAHDVIRMELDQRELYIILHIFIICEYIIPSTCVHGYHVYRNNAIKMSKIMRGEQSFKAVENTGESRTMSTQQ